MHLAGLLRLGDAFGEEAKATDLFPFAEGSSELCQASQPRSKRRRIHIFEQMRTFGTKVATKKML
jgi:hypothetical protein